MCVDVVSIDKVLGCDWDVVIEKRSIRISPCSVDFHRHTRLDATFPQGFIKYSDNRNNCFYTCGCVFANP